MNVEAKRLSLEQLKLVNTCTNPPQTQGDTKPDAVWPSSSCAISVPPALKPFVHHSKMFYTTCTSSAGGVDRSTQTRCATGCLPNILLKLEVIRVRRIICGSHFEHRRRENITQIRRGAHHVLQRRAVKTCVLFLHLLRRPVPLRGSRKIHRAVPHDDVVVRRERIVAVRVFPKGHRLAGLRLHSVLRSFESKQIDQKAEKVTRTSTDKLHSGGAPLIRHMRPQKPLYLRKTRTRRVTGQVPCLTRALGQSKN